MAEVEIEARASTRRRLLEQWAPLTGVVYFVLFTAFAVISFTALDTGDDVAGTQQALEEGFDSAWLYAAALLLLFSTLFFLVFLAELYASLRRVAADMLASLALVGGLAYVVLFVVSMAIWIAPLYATVDDAFGEADYRVFAETYWWVGNISWVTLTTGSIAGGLMLVAASLLATRYDLAPRWLAFVGVGAGVLAFFAFVIFFPLFLIPVWVLVAAVWMQIKALKRDEYKEAAGLRG